MGIKAIFSAANWAQVPFHFWTAVFFIYGSMVGSFLNVCIHRMPLGQSVVSPPSHCPHCKYSIPWYLNMPLFTWVFLRGKCANCGAPISVRYFLVELLTALVFMACWLMFGHQSAWLALVFCLFLAGLIAATFIDFEHFIIPDEITLGGAVVGLFCSLFVPALHGAASPLASLGMGLLGLLVGAGLVYFILRAGKFFLGRQKVKLEPQTVVVFTETSLVLPEGEIAYEELLYRKSDAIMLEATLVELCDRCYRNVSVRLSQSELRIGEDVLDPEHVQYLEATTGEVILPREAMGLGDVKFMAAIGAFLGWPAVVFSLGASAVIGSVVGVTLILCKKREWSNRMPYGPYIALAAAVWVFLPAHFREMWTQYLLVFPHVFFGTLAPGFP